MSDLGGLIFGQIPHCTEQNTSEMPGWWGRGMGGFGIDWYINYTKRYADTVEKDQFFYLSTSAGTKEARSARPLYNEGFATRKIFTKSTTSFHGLYSYRP